MAQPRVYTGEGFKGEKILAIIAAGMTIVSAILLIDLTILQRKHTKMELEAAQLKKAEDEEKKKKQADTKT